MPQFTSDTILMGVTAKQMYDLLNGNQPAVVKTMMPRKTVPPYTIYFYVNASSKYIKHGGLQFPDELLYSHTPEINAESIDFGCPYDTESTEVHTDLPVLNAKVVAKCECNEFQTLLCNSVHRERFSKDVGMTPNQLLDMCNCKDMGVWYFENIQLFDKPKTLEDFGMVRPPQNWCYLDMEGKEI